MAFTPTEQALYDFARASLPRWFFVLTRPEEILGAFVKQFDAARAATSDYFLQTRILTATGAGPDFLGEIARGLGTYRQDGETNAELRERLRNPEESLIFSALLAAIQAVLDAEGNAGTPGLVEMPLDRAFFRTSTSDAGTGGTFAGTAPDMEFTPTVDFVVGGIAGQSPLTPKLVGGQLVIAGAASAGNNGTFAITGLNGDAVQYQNGAGVAGADATAGWTHVKRDADGNVLDGFQDSYLTRGFRIGARKPPKVIAVLPFGCSAGTAASATEALRQKRGAGVVTAVECSDGLSWPQTDAALRAALGLTTSGLADSLYDFAELSGDALDHVASDNLSPVGSPAPLQGFSSQALAKVLATFAQGSTTQEFNAASSVIHDFTTGSFGWLVGFAFSQLPAGSPAAIIGKGIVGANYELHLDTAGVLHWLVDDGTTSVDVTVTPPATGSFADGQLHLAYCLRDATANDTQLVTTLGDATPGADVALTITNADLFKIGNDAGAGAHPAGDMEIGYLARFSGADAEAVGATQLSALYASLVTAAL